MQETQVQSLGPEDPLEKEMATNSSILVWRIPQTEEPGGIQSMVLQESDMIEWLTNTHTQYRDMHVYRYAHHLWMCSFLRN